MKWLADKIEHWPLERLVPYARNARTHSEEQVAQIAASIAEFGFVNPILVGSDGVIVAGHGRLAAARKLGLETAPVVVLDHLTPTQRRALVIADNRLAEIARWDAELLRIELDDLRDEGFDLDIVGFDEAALAEFFADEEPDHAGQTDPDEAPAVDDAPVSRPGDVWIMGGHRLVCGDATRTDAYERLFRAGEKARLLWADPPYNVAYAVDGQLPTLARRPIANDDLGEAFEPFLKDALGLALAHTDGACYIAMSSAEIHTLRQVFDALDGHWSDYLIWAKDTFTLGRADYQRQYEMILYGWPKGATRHWCGDRDQGDVWMIKKPARNDLHPTMKPVELVERAIRNSSRPGDVVLDPFGGSGTTLIAAEKSGRQARVIELDPKYVDTIVRRWQDYAGGQAMHEADGVRFDDLVSQQADAADAGDGMDAEEAL